MGAPADEGHAQNLFLRVSLQTLDEVADFGLDTDFLDLQRKIQLIDDFEFCTLYASKYGPRTAARLAVCYKKVTGADWAHASLPQAGPQPLCPVQGTLHSWPPDVHVR